MYPGLEGGHGNGVDIHHLKTDGFRAVALEWPEAGQHAVQHHSHREEVRACIGLSLGQLLWSHVCRASKYLPGVRNHCMIKTGHAKVRDLGMIIFSDQYVSRF